MTPAAPPLDNDDARLVARMAAGDESALAALYDRHAASVHGLVTAIVRDVAEAEEVTGDVFLQAWRDAASFDGGRAGVTAWLHVIARSRALDRLRARRRAEARVTKVVDEEREGIAFAPESALPNDPAELAVLGDMRAHITRALATLPADHRLLIERAYFGGLSQSEIAAEQQIPLGTVKTRIRMAMGKLRDALAAYSSTA